MLISMSFYSEPFARKVPLAITFALAGFIACQKDSSSKVDSHSDAPSNVAEPSSAATPRSTPVKAMLEAYTNLENCADRTKFTLAGAGDAPRIKAYYSHSRQADCVFKGSWETVECESVAVGSYCDATLKKTDGASHYCVICTGETDFKVDFSCSVGWNDPSLASIRADRLTHAVPIRAELGPMDLFEGLYANQSRWRAASISDSLGRSLAGTRAEMLPWATPSRIF